MNQLQLIKSMYSRPFKSKKRNKKKIISPNATLTSFSSGIQTNSIIPLSTNTGNVQLMANNQYNSLNLGGTLGTTHNGPITFKSSYKTSSMSQIGYTLNGYPNNTINSNTSSIGFNDFYVNSVPSTPYLITQFKPGNYLCCINGSVTLTGSDNSTLDIYSGFIWSPTQTIPQTSSSMNYILGIPILHLTTSVDSNKCIPITCKDVITISSTAYNSYPTSTYIAGAISIGYGPYADTGSSDFSVSINVMSYSITRIG